MHVRSQLFTHVRICALSRFSSVIHQRERLHSHVVGCFQQNTSCLRNMPSASGGQKCGLRQDNSHWTAEEVTTLVGGIEDCGAGRWTKLKKIWFSTSVRTAMHVKVKWFGDTTGRMMDIICSALLPPTLLPCPFSAFLCPMSMLPCLAGTPSNSLS